MGDTKNKRLENKEKVESALQERVNKLERDVAYLKGVVTTLVALLVGVALRVFLKTQRQQNKVVL